MSLGSSERDGECPNREGADFSRGEVLGVGPQGRKAEALGPGAIVVVDLNASITKAVLPQTGIYRIAAGTNRVRCLVSVYVH